MAAEQQQPKPAPEGTATDSIVLEEEIDPNYVPSEAEVIEYAKWLGMDLKSDADLFWVAKEGLMAPLPKNWKPCKTKDTEDIYYFNFSTGDSTWDHPCDGYYKRLYEEEKKKKEVQMKESSDQVRTRAKQDVDQLLGKGEKKRRKKSVDSIDSLSATATKFGGPGGGSSSSSIAPLGPLSTLEKKPLPGIQPLTSIASSTSMAPLRRELPQQLSTTQSISSLEGVRNSTASREMNTAFGKSTSKDTPSSTIEIEEADSKNKAKKSSRINSAIADSDDQSKLDSPPVRRSAESKIESKPERQSESVDIDRLAITAEAKLSRPQQSINSPSDAVPSTTSRLDGNSDELVAKLRLQVRRLEGDFDVKTRQCDRLEAENADLERRLTKEKRSAKELQESHEETEQKLLKQIKTLKEEVSGLDKQVEESITQERQLRTANRELALANEQLRNRATSSGESGDSGGEAATARYAELQEELSKLEESKRRARALSADLKEQLTKQEEEFKMKLAATAAAEEDESGTALKLRQECEDLKRKLQKAVEERDAATLKSPLSQPQASEEKVSSQPDDASTKMQLQMLSIELSQAKMERDDFANKIKRLELSIASWESDCKDKETRLQLARTTCNDLESELLPLKASLRQITAVELANANDKARLLEMECDSLKNEQSILQEKLRNAANALAVQSSLNSTPQADSISIAAEKEKNELQDALESEKSANQQSERKMRGFQEELIQLQRRLQEVKDGQLAAECAATGKLESELGDAKALLAAAETKIASLSVEVDNFHLKMAALTERNAVLQAEADRLREVLSAIKGGGAAVMSTSVMGREIELETILATKREELSRNNETITSLRLQVDEIHAKLVNEKLTTEKLLTEKAELTAALSKKDLAYRDADSAASRLKIDLALAEKEIDFTKTELSQLCKEEEKSRRLRLDLEKEMAGLKATLSHTKLDMETSQSVGSRTSQAEGSIVELSIIVGRQQAVVAQLESKLHEAEAKINDFGVSPRQKKEVVVPAPPQPEASLPKALPEVAEVLSSNQEQSQQQQPSQQEDQHGRASVADLDQSLLRETMLDFVRRRRPFIDGFAASQQEPLSQQSLSNWNSKIFKEKKFLLDARRRLKDEKVAIRLEQSGLMKRREAWKKNRHDPLIGGVAKTKEVAHQLNRQTLQLNLAIEQAKRTQQWLDEREQKLDRLAELIEEPLLNESHQGNEEIGGLCRELDTDATVIVLEPFLPLQPSFHHDHRQQLPYSNQENVFPQQLESFFPESAADLGTGNTYLQSQLEERMKRGGRGRPILQPAPSGPETTSAYYSSRTDVTQQDRRLLQLKIQREVEERNRYMMAYQEHAGWLDGLRTEIAVYKHEKRLPSKSFGASNFGAPQTQNLPFDL